MTPSDPLRAFVQAWEGCVLTPYADQGGLMTVGVGHKLPRGAPRTPISQDDADVLFSADLGTTGSGVGMWITDAATQEQYDACVSFAFNLGVKSLRDSTLLRKLNGGDVAGAGQEFEKWCHVGAQVSDGVLKRRLAERAIFLNSDYSGRP